MKYMRSHEQSVVLIVVIGVLAVLSLIAATFAMIMRVEMAATRNQMEYQMAREAAHAGSEYLLKELAPYATGITSGPLDIDDICPNPPHSSAHGCQKLYERDGVMAWFSIEEHPYGSSYPWTQGLGVEAGAFNINGMGYEADLGSNANYDIRYTSFDTSLARLITARLATLTAAEIADVDSYRLGYPSIGLAAEQQRMGILLARAIVRYRHGPDGVPGSANTEENRLGHLPRWSGTIGCSDANAGVQYPADTDNAYEFGFNDGLPSYLLRRNANVATRWCYAEPGLWTTNDGATWQDDVGVQMFALRYVGTVAAFPASNTTTIYAETSAAEWTDWPNNLWNTYWLYCRRAADLQGEFRQITMTVGPNILTVAPALSFSPAAGDELKIYLGGGFLGGNLDRRWDAVSNATGDLIPTGFLWPDGLYTGENNVYDRVLDSGTVADSGNTPSPFLEDNDATPAKQWTTWFAAGYLNGKMVHIYAGRGAGQVRRITSYTDTQLTLDSDWTTPPGGSDLDSGTLSASNNAPPYVEDSTKTWLTAFPPDDPATTLVGGMVRITSGAAIGQAREITGYSDNRLELSEDWAILPGFGDAYRIEMPSYYRIEFADNNLPSKYQPDNLQGDDRIYSTLGILRDSVISPALGPAGDGLTIGNADAVADIIMPTFQKYLTVSARSLESNQELGGINDWATDGVDNDSNGVVDDEQATGVAIAKSLYVKLGLKEWAHEDETNAAQLAERIKQSAQLLANIIDFRDADDVPTVLNDALLGETAAVGGPFTVYGAEGLHVTEVMASPDPIHNTDGLGTEMTNDGTGPFPPGTPLVGWEWGGTTWDAMDGSTASFTFGGLTAGHYAVRLIGSGGPITITYGGTAYTVDLLYPEPVLGYMYGFVRDAGSSLVNFDATGGSLTFDLTASGGTSFYGFALCPQFIEITNIAAHDIDMNGWTVVTDASTGLGSITIPSNPGYRRVPGSFGDGKFPINYGNYVVAMSEASYDMQWGTNKTGKWGDAPEENYPIFPIGDFGDSYARQLLLGAGTYTPTVALRNDKGNLIAGGAVDGDIGTVTDVYSSMEKNVILQPTWDTPPATPLWAGFPQPIPVALAASQNVQCSVAADLPRDAGSASIYSCLNSAYGDLWAGYPALETASTLAGSSLVYPIILNRPYPTAGWLGLVPTSSAPWRTVDPDPTPADAPAAPEELLGTLISHATPGGIYARFNINSADADALKAVFDDNQAAELVGARTAAGDAWARWDNLLTDSFFQNASNDFVVPSGLGFYDAEADSGVFSNEDSGAGTFADDFKDDSDEKEEWARRYSNLFDLRSTTFKFTVAGFVYKLDASPADAPVAAVRLELDVDLSDATAGPRVVHMRYLGQ